jgi:hypothetical protein
MCHFQRVKTKSRTTKRGNPTMNPSIQCAPAVLPILSVHPIHGHDFGTHVRLSFLLSAINPTAENCYTAASIRMSQVSSRA